MRWFNRIVISLFVLAALVYAGDWVVLRFRRQPVGSIEVHQTYAVPQKDHKLEYYPGDTIEQACVHSLFPHRGDPPCWWVSRHSERQINM
jgi:hypothetical protein